MTSKPIFEDYDGSTPVENWTRNFRMLVVAATPLWTKGIEAEKKDAAVNLQAIIQFKLHMKGNLADWVDTVNTEKMRIAELLSLLETHKLGSDYLIVRKQKAMDLKFSDCEDLADYYAKKVSLMNKAFKDQNEPDKMIVSQEFILDLYLNGFNEKVRAQLLIHPIESRDTLDKLQALAVKLDAVVKAKNKEKEKDDLVNATDEGEKAVNIDQRGGHYKKRGGQYSNRGGQYSNRGRCYRGRRGRGQYGQGDRTGGQNGDGNNNNDTENDVTKERFYNKSDIICYGCGGRGHMKNVCPSVHPPWKGF